MEKKSNSFKIIIIIAALILIAGGIYLYKNRASKQGQPIYNQAATNPAKDSTVSGGNDNVSSIEADLNKLDIDSLDQGI